MNIIDLYDLYKDKEKTIYIIGTGPTLRLFPAEFFKSQVTIGLNYAWKLISCRYNLTIHPETIPRTYLDKYPEEVWITKRKDWLKKPNTKQLYHTFWFENNSQVKDYSFLTSTNSTLYVGRGIHTAGLNLAAKMGARTAVLVGCDMRAYDTQHNATGESVRFHGMPPDGVYTEYYLNAKEVRNQLYNHYGMHVLNLTPLLGNRDSDFDVLLEERGLVKFPPVKDVSSYNRKKLDFTS